jgi:hypothetical protein
MRLAEEQRVPYLLLSAREVGDAQCWEVPKYGMKRAGRYKSPPFIPREFRLYTAAILPPSDAIIESCKNEKIDCMVNMFLISIHR